MKKLEDIYLVLKWDDINRLSIEDVNRLIEIVEKIKKDRETRNKIPTIRLIDVACYD